MKNGHIITTFKVFVVLNFQFHNKKIIFSSKRFPNQVGGRVRRSANPDFVHVKKNSRFQTSQIYQYEHYFTKSISNKHIYYVVGHIISIHTN